MAGVKLVAYILFAYGMANMVVYANGPFGIFEKWRTFTNKISESFGELFTCMICLSTWIGLIFSIVNTYIVPSIPFTPFNVIFGTGTEHVIIKTVLDLAATSGAVWLLHNLEEAMERHGNYVIEDEQVGADIEDERDEK